MDIRLFPSHNSPEHFPGYLSFPRLSLFLKIPPPKMPLLKFPRSFPNNSPGQSLRTFPRHSPGKPPTHQTHFPSQSASRPAERHDTRAAYRLLVQFLGVQTDTHTETDIHNTDDTISAGNKRSRGVDCRALTWHWC